MIEEAVETLNTIKVDNSESNEFADIL